MFSLLIALVLVGPAQAQECPLSKNEVRMIEEINQYRAGCHQPPVKMNPIMMKAARERCPYYSHHAQGQGCYEACHSRGYKGMSVAENIAMGQSSAKACVSAWAKSPGHARNMQGNYEDVGVAHTPDDKWISIFGRQ